MYEPSVMSPQAPGLTGSFEQEETGAGAGLAVLIWIPTAAMSAALIAAGVPYVALMLVGTVTLLHSLLHPRVAIYVLVFVLPFEWTINVIPGLMPGRMIAIWAGFVSLPILIPSITSRWDRCAKWIVIIILWEILTCFWAPIPAYSLSVVQMTSSNWGLPLLIGLHLKTSAAIRKGLMLFILGCLLSAVLIIRTNAGDLARSKERAQTVSMIGEQTYKEDSNVPSRTMALGTIACLFLLITSRNPAFRVGCVLGIVVIAAAIIMCKGRAVYLGLPVAIAGGLILLRGAGLTKRLLLVLVIGVVGAATAYAMTSLGFFGQGVTDRFNSIFEEGTKAGHRGAMWTAHFAAFLRTGFRGAGIGSMRFTAESNYHVAHNDFISIMGELGAIGLICYVSFHATLFLRMWRMGEIWTKSFCMMAWIFIMFASLTQNDFSGKHYTIAVAFILAWVRNSEARSLPNVQAMYMPAMSQSYRTG